MGLFFLKMGKGKKDLGRRDPDRVEGRERGRGEWGGECGQNISCTCMKFIPPSSGGWKYKFKALPGVNMVTAFFWVVVCLPSHGEKKVRECSGVIYIRGSY